MVFGFEGSIEGSEDNTDSLFVAFDVAGGFSEHGFVPSLPGLIHGSIDLENIRLSAIRGKSKPTYHLGSLRLRDAALSTLSFDGTEEAQLLKLRPHILLPHQEFQGVSIVK